MMLELEAKIIAYESSPLAETTFEVTWSGTNPYTDRNMLEVWATI